MINRDRLSLVKSAQLYNYDHDRMLFFLFLSDGEPLKLPESLESLPKSDHFPGQRHRWNTNEVSDE